MLYDKRQKVNIVENNKIAQIIVLIYYSYNDKKSGV